jgi:lipoprotein-anchoring transpeptidase ErfK/SrfK
MRTLRPLFVLAIAAAAISACGGGGTSSSSTTEHRASPPTAVANVETVTTEPAATGVEPVDGLVATASSDVAVYMSTAATEPASMLPAHTEFGSPTTLRVVGWEGSEGQWLEVLLPVRPNGARGFVRAADVELARVDLVVDVDLATKTLRVFDADSLVLETAVAIGSDDNPTPVGEFFVTDVLDTGDDGSAYGRKAVGVSAHSETLSEFGGGDGQIGIHGTNQPSSIGQAVSHGCVRVPNDIVTLLAQMLPLGTPVTFH